MKQLRYLKKIRPEVDETKTELRYVQPIDCAIFLISTIFINGMTGLELITIVASITMMTIGKMTKSVTTATEASKSCLLNSISKVNVLIF